MISYCLGIPVLRCTIWIKFSIEMLWITKMVIFSPKPMAFIEGSPFSCFYNFKWSEISIDWKGVALLLLIQIEWNNSMGRLNDNDSYLIDPLLEKHLCPHLQEFGKIYIFKYLEKNKHYWSRGHRCLPTKRSLKMEPLSFSLPFPLFHFIWIHNKGTCFQSPFAVISLHLRL